MPATLLLLGPACGIDDSGGKGDRETGTYVAGAPATNTGGTEAASGGAGATAQGGSGGAPLTGGAMANSGGSPPNSSSGAATAGGRGGALEASGAAPSTSGDTSSAGASTAGTGATGGPPDARGGTDSAGGAMTDSGGATAVSAGAGQAGRSNAGGAGTAGVGGTSTAGLGGTGTAGVGGTGTVGSAGTTNSGAIGDLVAFPGAEGFGRLASGARGGDVYHVTNLSDSGIGSLRDAISGPNRTIVFDVSGVIHLSERLVFLSNQTIAGQTAPGGGIVVYGNGTSFTNANNTIVRYMRFRMGVGGDSGKDSISIARGHDMIFDHCSISWGRDGNFDINQESGYELRNITLQDSIVAQGLQTHSTGGLLVADGVSVLRSLYIDNNSRNPKARQTTQWVNNIDYNWVASGYILGDTSGRSDGYMVGNYFIPGPETNGGTLSSPTSSYHLYASGNWYDNDKDGTLGGRLLTQGDFGSVSWETTPSVEFPAVTEMSAEEAYAHVLQNAGASLWRDQVDDYVIAELASLGASGATISDESSLGLSANVGEIPSAEAPPDTDQDGMPDGWEQALGLDPNDAADRNGDRNGDGWTNLEEYLDSLVP